MDRAFLTLAANRIVLAGSVPPDPALAASVLLTWAGTMHGFLVVKVVVFIQFLMHLARRQQMGFSPA